MEICGIKFAPLNVPLERRLQTIATAAWAATFVFAGLTGSVIMLYLILYTRYWWIASLYLFWIWIIDKDIVVKGGRRSEWVRSWIWWKYFRDYFPLKFQKLEGVELDPKKNYLFCSFPHGILPTGVFNAFLSEYSEYKQYFPHHTPYLVTLPQQFILPLGRDLALGLGAISCSNKSIEYVLSRPGGGHAVCLVVGGAKEAYYCKPGSYRVVLKNRKGFVKLALRNGASLVPMLSFGETDLYDQLEGPRLRGFQEALRKWIVMAPIIPIGRGFFQYSFGFVPRRRPVVTVVGEPLDVPKIEFPTDEQITEYHEKFIQKLTALFEEQKFNYLENPEDKKLILE